MSIPFPVSVGLLTNLLDSSAKPSRIDSFLKLPPGRSQTPRLPVILDPNGIGFDAVKRALGRSLKMDAVARVGVRIGDYSDVVTYRGKGISANVRV